MYSTFFGKITKGFGSCVYFNDRLSWIGAPEESNGNSLVQIVDGKEISFPLSSGIPVLDLEESDRMVNRDLVEGAKAAFVTDNLDRDGTTLLDFTNRYHLLRFIVDEIFPNMVAAPLDDRIDAIVTGEKKVKTGREIIQEAFANETKTTFKSVELRTHTVERLEREMGRPLESYSDLPHIEAISEPPTGKRLSVFNNVVRNYPFLMLRGKIYFLTRTHQGSDLVIKFGDRKFGYLNKPMYYLGLEECYQQHISHAIRQDAIEEIKQMVKNMKSVIIKDVEYMPLMDKDEFRFRDIGYFRNGDVYYVFKRIPKFARQTTYDENLFVAKEFDNEGFAGDFGIGLKIEGGKVRYLGYHVQDGGVIYRGPIKEDAPFHSTVQIIDPVQRSKYGTYRTICHVGGYPTFPLSADGFIQFLTYATTNFLDSFRQKFVDQHFDAQEQARLLDAGKLMKKQTTIDQGYVITNLHKIEKKDENRS